MKKDNNIKAFFELLRAGLWEKEVWLLPCGEVDYNEVMRIAEMQSVEGLVTAGIEHIKEAKPPQDVVLQFIGQSLQIEERNRAMNHFIAEIVDKMQNAGIYTLLVKGQGVAQCYERPLWRSSGDVDFLLSEGNFVKAREYLRPLIVNGYDPNDDCARHLSAKLLSWNIELHANQSCGLSRKMDQGILEIQKALFYEGDVRSWMVNGVQVFLPGADCDVILIFTHFLKHFYRGGLGLRQICDWCRLLWKFQSKLDLKMIESRIRKMGLMTEWKAFGAFAVEYLGLPKEAMPFYSADVKWKRKADKIRAFILVVGNMGHNRDMSYFEKYPYLIRKVCSMGRRCGDLIRHARIFPLDSLRFFPRIMFNGLRSAVKGE